MGQLYRRFITFNESDKPNTAIKQTTMGNTSDK